MDPILQIKLQIVREAVKNSNFLTQKKKGVHRNIEHANKKTNLCNGVKVIIDKKGHASVREPLDSEIKEAMDSALDEDLIDELVLHDKLKIIKATPTGLNWINVEMKDEMTLINETLNSTIHFVRRVFFNEKYR